MTLALERLGLETHKFVCSNASQQSSHPEFHLSVPTLLNYIFKAEHFGSLDPVNDHSLTPQVFIVYFFVLWNFMRWR
jgi:hypothetical protein